MKDFLFVYRSNFNDMPKRSPEEMQALTKRWMDWIGSIAAQSKLTDRGNRLEPAGKVLRADGVITDGPYTECPFGRAIQGRGQRKSPPMFYNGHETG